MGETKVTASFKFHSREETNVPVVNPFNEDKICIIEIGLGYSSSYWVVEAGYEDAIEVLADSEEYGACVRISDEDKTKYGERINPGDDINGIVYEKGGWFRADGEIIDDPDADLYEARMTGNGIWVDDDNVMIHTIKSGRVRYFGIYDGASLPHDGVLASNMRQWHDFATQSVEQVSRRKHREEMRWDHYTTCKNRIHQIFDEAEHLGWSSARLSAELQTRLKRTHEYRQLGRDYTEYLGGYEAGYRKQWERRVLENRYCFHDADWTFLTEGDPRLPTTFPARDKVRHLGLFYRGTLCNYDRGEEPAWVILQTPSSGYLKKDSLGFGPLSEAKLFYSGEKRLKQDLAGGFGLEWVSLFDMRHQAEQKVAEQFKENLLGLATRVFDMMGNDYRMIWQSAANLAEKYDGLASWYVRLMPLGELESWIAD